jgi:hypothetical protein
MKKPRKWIRWALAGGIAVALAGVAVAFVPDESESECWRSVWLAKASWTATDTELAALQKRLSALQTDSTTDDELDRLQGEWEFWAAARQAANLAATQSDQAPELARASSKLALEACWLARDNTEETSAGTTLPGRTYRPGALAVMACEQAAAASEGSWSRCEYKMLEFYRLAAMSAQGDYDFFGGGCVGGF